MPKAPSQLQPVKWEFPFIELRDDGKGYLTLPAIRALQQMFGVMQWDGGLLDLAGGNDRPATDFSPLYSRIDELENQIASLRGTLDRAQQAAEEALLLTKPSAAVDTSTGNVPTTRVLTAGAGLTGGGDLSADRTFDVGAGTGITVNANDVALDTSHARNVDHSAVTITAGAGLTGGGTIESTRTLDVGAGTGITVNANDVALTVPVSVANGGTNATTEAGARTSLGLVIGTDVQAYDADLAALAANSTDGLWAHTGAGTGAARTLTASTGISVSNGNGVSGNPTVALASTAVSAGSYGSEAANLVITVDAQGRLTAAAASTTDAITTISASGSVNIANSSTVLFDLASPGNITGWSNVIPGKIYVMRSTNGNATITTAGAYLKAGTSKTLTASASMIFVGHTTTLVRQLTDELIAI